MGRNYGCPGETRLTTSKTANIGHSGSMSLKVERRSERYLMLCLRPTHHNPSRLHVAPKSSYIPYIGVGFCRLESQRADFSHTSQSVPWPSRTYQTTQVCSKGHSWIFVMHSETVDVLYSITDASHPHHDQLGNRLGSRLAGASQGPHKAPNQSEFLEDRIACGRRVRTRWCF
ncbi:hypothetical protein BDY21DRAFT_358543 [Lineolata rhizophorae]|uniref:Uncharacterized protein n=1 Tax=Lineolata rhizophorae TaxID=578093 RepID=A0A6A6NLR4_9PEZI|nr:hypothetical protein BDY21DRAFT_358543 [Lineolata rhizophorae]